MAEDMRWTIVAFVHPLTGILWFTAEIQAWLVGYNLAREARRESSTGIGQAPIPSISENSWKSVWVSQ